MKTYEEWINMMDNNPRMGYIKSAIYERAVKLLVIEYPEIEEVLDRCYGEEYEKYLKYFEKMNERDENDLKVKKLLEEKKWKEAEEFCKNEKNMTSGLKIDVNLKLKEVGYIKKSQKELDMEKLYEQKPGEDFGERLHRIAEAEFPGYAQETLKKNLSISDKEVEKVEKIKDQLKKNKRTI